MNQRIFLFRLDLECSHPRLYLANFEMRWRGLDAIKSHGFLHLTITLKSPPWTSSKKRPEVTAFITYFALPIPLTNKNTASEPKLQPYCKDWKRSISNFNEKQQTWLEGFKKWQCKRIESKYKRLKGRCSCKEK